MFFIHVSRISQIDRLIASTAAIILPQSFQSFFVHNVIQTVFLKLASQMILIGQIVHKWTLAKYLYQLYSKLTILKTYAGFCALLHYLLKDQCYPSHNLLQVLLVLILFNFGYCGMLRAIHYYFQKRKFLIICSDWSGFPKTDFFYVWITIDIAY